MKVGSMNVLFGGRPLEEALKFFDSIGIHDLEIGAGGNPGKAHCNPEILLSDKTAYDKFVETFKKYNMTINALACHGNPVHPNKEIASMYHNGL